LLSIDGNGKKVVKSVGWTCIVPQHVILLATLCRPLQFVSVKGPVRRHSGKGSGPADRLLWPGANDQNDGENWRGRHGKDGRKIDQIFPFPKLITPASYVTCFVKEWKALPPHMGDNTLHFEDVATLLEMKFLRLEGQLHTVMYLEFAVDIFDVPANRAECQAKLLCDLLVRVSLYNQMKYIELTSA
jgi:hypothetical protein